MLNETIILTFVQWEVVLMASISYLRCETNNILFNGYIDNNVSNKFKLYSKL
jgi:hypothetical protein